MSDNIPLAVQVPIATQQLVPGPNDKVKVIIIVGKTGTGKSSLGNLLLNQKRFAVCHGSFSQTKIVECGFVNYCGTWYKIIDTVGICDDELTTEDVLSRIAHVVDEIPNGELAQLLLVYDGKVTEETLEAMRIITAVMHDRSILHHTCIIRTKSEFYDVEDECEKERVSLRSKTKEKYRYMFKEANRILFVENPHVASNATPTELENCTRKQKDARLKLFSYLETVVNTYKLPFYEETMARVQELVKEDKEREAKFEERIKELEALLKANQINNESFKMIFEQMAKQNEDIRKHNAEMIGMMMKTIQDINNRPPPVVDGGGGCNIL